MRKLAATPERGEGFLAIMKAVEDALRFTDGNLSESARLLKIDRMQLRRYVEKFKLKR